MSFVSVTGSPSSSAIDVPPLSLSVVSIIYFITDGESPAVYELTKKNSGLSDITCEASLIKLSILS